MWPFLPGRGKPVPAPGKRRSWFRQQPDVGAGKTVLPPLGVCQPPLTWAGGAVWQSTQFQKHVDRSMEIQRMDATGMLQETDLQDKTIKVGMVCVILANRARGGQRRVGGGQEGPLVAPVNKEVCHKGSGLRCEEALLSPESTLSNSAPWEACSCSLALFSSRSQAPFTDQAMAS